MSKKTQDKKTAKRGKAPKRLPYDSPTLKRFGTMSEITHQTVGSFGGPLS